MDYCDDCLADELPLKRRQQAQATTASLALTSEFSRGKRICSLCGKNNDVIHAI